MTRAQIRSTRAGFTFLEIAVVIVVMSVALAILASTVTAGSQLRAVNRERGLAADACRTIVESMRNEDFAQVFALYNTHPGDDPAGAGTAPGDLFDVPGLTPLAAAPGGLQGRIYFPTVGTFPEEPLIGAQLRLADLIMVMGLAPPAWELRENVDVPNLGMQRDLNGDTVIDGEGHSDDYIILPVEVRIEWSGRAGQMQFSVFTMLTEMREP